MAGSGGATSLSEQDEDEWEYEYDPVETEDYHFVLDLTTNTSFFRNLQDQQRTKGRTSVGTGTNKGNSLGIGSTVGDTEQRGASNGSNGQAANNTNDSSANGLKTTPSQSKIQLLNLHTNEPLISYNGRIYTCTWSATLGTNLLFTAPPEHKTAEEIRAERHKRKRAPLLAATSARLVATHATLVPPEGAAAAAAAQGPEQEQEQAAVIGTPSKRKSGPKPRDAPEAEPLWSTYTHDPSQPFRITIPASQKPIRKAQAAFLERLQNLKRARGERDHVIVRAKTKEPVYKASRYLNSKKGKFRQGGGAGVGQVEGQDEVVMVEDDGEEDEGDDVDEEEDGDEGEYDEELEDEDETHSTKRPKPLNRIQFRKGGKVADPGGDLESRLLGRVAPTTWRIEGDKAIPVINYETEGGGETELDEELLALADGSTDDDEDDDDDEGKFENTNENDEAMKVDD